MNMATEDPDETWEEFYKTNQSIPVHPSRITTENGRSGQPYCFCLNVTSVELNSKSEVLFCHHRTFNLFSRLADDQCMILLLIF